MRRSRLISHVFIPILPLSSASDKIVLCLNAEDKGKMGINASVMSGERRICPSLRARATDPHFNMRDGYTYVAPDSWVGSDSFVTIGHRSTYICIYVDLYMVPYIHSTDKRGMHTCLSEHGQMTLLKQDRSLDREIHRGSDGRQV